MIFDLYDSDDSIEGIKLFCTEPQDKVRGC